jgi:hypothetical protein
MFLWWGPPVNLRVWHLNYHEPCSVMQKLCVMNILVCLQNYYNYTSCLASRWKFPSPKHLLNSQTVWFKKSKQSLQIYFNKQWGDTQSFLWRICGSLLCHFILLFCYVVKYDDISHVNAYILIWLHFITYTVFTPVLIELHVSIFMYMHLFGFNM